jgi:uroporphyrinogen-III synthase
MGLSHQPVILMRPGAANDRLAAKLKADGIEAWCWPAFTITLPEDQELVAQRLAHLDDVDMVVLASRTGCRSGPNTLRWPPSAKALRA